MLCFLHWSVFWQKSSTILLPRYSKLRMEIKSRAELVPQYFVLENANDENDDVSRFTTQMCREHAVSECTISPTVRMRVEQRHPKQLFGIRQLSCREKEGMQKQNIIFVIFNTYTTFLLLCSWKEESIFFDPLYNCSRNKWTILSVINSMKRIYRPLFRYYDDCGKILDVAPICVFFNHTECLVIL